MTRVPLSLFGLTLFVACRSAAEPPPDPVPLDMPDAAPTTVGWGGGAPGARPLLVREIEQAPGRIALEGEGVPMQFRNLRLTPLGRRAR